MTTGKGDDRPTGSSAARPRPLVDPVGDAVARREEEFRRFLVSVVGPAFDELRAAFKADGRDVRIGRSAAIGRSGEATIEVGGKGQAAFVYTLTAAIGPERAAVVKRRTVADHAAPAATRVEATPLIAGSAPASDARTVTRADVVSSVRADERTLRRALGDG